MNSSALESRDHGLEITTLPDGDDDEVSVSISAQRISLIVSLDKDIVSLVNISVIKHFSSL